MDGDPGDGTGEVFGEEWRFPVISIMSWPMSFSSSSGKGRSKGRSSVADTKALLYIPTGDGVQPRMPCWTLPLLSSVG